MAPLLALGCCLTVAATSPATAVDFDACLKTLQARAHGEGIAEPIVRDVLPKLQQQPRVLELDRQQPEFSQTLAAYLNARAGERRVAQGRRLIGEQRPFLAALTQRYGVPGHYLIALWGLETGYGSYLGTMPTLDSLATLACDGRRGAFFAGELWDALRLLERHGLRADDMRGSWAGAVGHTQFLPSSYLRYAVDGDGDGRIDLWRSHRDALASGAHLLQALGWLPHGFRRRAWGTWGWPLVISSEERAVLELTGAMVGKSHADYDDFIRTTDSLQLDATQLQPWLSSCRSRKAVRLFLWMADFNRLPGLEGLDLRQVNRGSGHMYLVAPDEEGRYCSHLDLSVPAGLYWERDDWDMVF